MTEKRDKRNDVVIGPAGDVLPAPAGGVRAHIDAVLADPASRLILVIAELGGEIVMPVMGAPSRDTLELLETAVAAYRTALDRVDRH